MTIPEIARRLGIGKVAVYSMLERKLLPGIWLGHRWIVTRYAYEQWERTWECRRVVRRDPRKRGYSKEMPVHKRKYGSGKTVWFYKFDAPGSTRLDRRVIKE